METLQALKKRRSCRRYLKKQISDKDLSSILLAGTMAPVGGNRYDDIYITVVQNPDLLMCISTECKETYNGKTFNPTEDILFKHCT